MTLVEERGRPTAVLVGDSGMGIPEDLLESILEPYEQGDGPATIRKEGAGLGLAISWSICELLGCGLDIESRVGAGTTVTVTLGTLPEA